MHLKVPIIEVRGALSPILYFKRHAPFRKLGVSRSGWPKFSQSVGILVEHGLLDEIGKLPFNLLKTDGSVVMGSKTL